MYIHQGRIQLPYSAIIIRLVLWRSALIAEIMVRLIQNYKIQAVAIANYLVDTPCELTMCEALLVRI